MDAVIQQLMTEFCTERGFNSWPESGQFEVFATHCVLSEHTFEPFAAAEFRIGGSADGGIDGYGIVVNERLFSSPDDLERFIDDTAEISPTIVIIQAKSSPRMDRKYISDLRVRVENILRTDIVLDNAADVEPLRECLRVIEKHLHRLSNRGVRLEVIYANTSVQANTEIRREAERAAEAMAGVGVVSEAGFTCMGRDELARLYERSLYSSVAKLNFITHYSMPTDSGVTRARHGVVAAHDLVDALSDGNKALNPALFSENIREFQPTASVNEEIRATLRDESQRRRFAVLNNGITIVARSLKAWSGSQVVLRDFQVVNGCQTCHVLAEEKDLLDDVAVKVQVVECDDDEVVNEIVTATNRQTEIPRAYFTNRKRLIRRLEVHYRRQNAHGYPLYFERRPGKGANDLRNGVIGINRQLRAYIAMCGRLAPSNDHRNFDQDFDKLFGRATEEELFIAASALYRWSWLVDTKRIAPRYRLLGYQAIAALGVLYGVRPLAGSDKDKQTRLAKVKQVIWSDGKWELLGIDIQPILDEALAGLSSPDPKNAAASLTFGESVVTLARKRGPR